jgi:flagellar hook-associated protein 2
MRIGGLASGMDIDQIVKDLMKAERMPLDKLYQKKQLLEWQRDDYREMNKALDELDKLIFDGVFKQASFLKKTMTSSNDSKVVATAVNAPANVTTQVEVINLATAASWKATNGIQTGGTYFTADKKIKADTTLSFKVMDPDGTQERTVTFKVYKDDTIDTVISRINSSGLGVSAMKENILVSSSPDTYAERVVFTNNKTGAGGYIKADDVNTKTFLEELGFTVPGGAAPYTLNPTTPGVDATVKINGFQIQKKSNTFTINGISYTIKDITAANEKVTISASTDVDAIFNTIKSFIDKYNEVIGKINNELKEERYRDYPPLTDEQKEAMTEKQIELWEEKARSGMLRNDSILSSGLSKMRMDLYTKVEGSNITSGFSQLAEIGITTSSNYLDGGKLIIDETKLREKIQENPDAIYRLFNNDSTNYLEKGIARRLRDTIKDTIGKIEQKAGKTLWTNQQFAIGRNLNQINAQIDRFEDRLKQIEDRYWRQFIAMEEAINKANSQSMYLMNAFGGGAQ